MKKDNVDIFSSNNNGVYASNTRNSVMPNIQSVLNNIRRDNVPQKDENAAGELSKGLLINFKPTYYSKSCKIIGYSKPDNQTGFPFAFDLEKEYNVVLHLPTEEEPPILFIVSSETILQISAAAPDNELHQIFQAMALKTVYVHDLKKTFEYFVKQLGGLILPRRIIDTNAAATILHFSKPHGSKQPELAVLLRNFIRPRFIPKHLLAEYTKPHDIAIHQAMSLPYLQRELVAEIRRRFGSAECVEIENNFLLEAWKIENTGVSVDSSVLRPKLSELEEQRVAIERSLKTVQQAHERNKLQFSLNQLIPEISFLRFFTNTVDGRVYGTFKPYSCPSGRISISNSYLQGIRREYKSMIYRAQPGKTIISADFPASQLRIAAVITGDNGLIQSIKDDKDLHRQTAAKIFKKEEPEVTDDERQIGKTANFQLLFGTGVESFKEKLEEKTWQKFNILEVKAMIKAFRDGYPAIAEWQNHVAETINAGSNENPTDQAPEFPYVTTLSGKHIYVAEYNQALNFAIAGSEAEILKKAVVYFANECRDKGINAQIINLIHDNIVAEASILDKEAASELLKEAIEMAINLTLKPFLTTIEVETLSESPLPQEEHEITATQAEPIIIQENKK